MRCRCTDPVCVFRIWGVPIFENYMCLVMYLFGFEADWTRRRMFFAEECAHVCRVVADGCDGWMAELMRLSR